MTTTSEPTTEELRWQVAGGKDASGEYILDDAVRVKCPCVTLLVIDNSTDTLSDWLARGGCNVCAIGGESDICAWHDDACATCHGNGWKPATDLAVWLEQVSEVWMKLLGAERLWKVRLLVPPPWTGNGIQGEGPTFYAAQARAIVAAGGVLMEVE